jgi:hypothetical protein
MQKAALLDDLVGQRDNGERQARHPGGLRLITSSNLVGAGTGRSPSFSPSGMNSSDIRPLVRVKGYFTRLKYFKSGGG